MENENEIKDEISSFLNTIDRIQADMKKLVEFAEKLKMKQEADMLFQDMSVFTRFGIENSEGPLSTKQLATLLKMISEKSPDQVLSNLKDNTDDDIEKIKKQVQDILNAIKDKAKNEKNMEDKLIKKIKKFIEIVEKKLETTQRQAVLDEYFSLKQQEEMKVINSRESLQDEEENRTFIIKGEITMKKFKPN